MSQQWEYLYMLFYVGDGLKPVDAELSAAGAAGFELVGWTTLEISGTTIDWSAILKRPGKHRKSPDGKRRLRGDGEESENDGWYPDPYASHEQRYWSGYYWTQYLSDAVLNPRTFPAN